MTAVCSECGEVHDLLPYDFSEAAPALDLGALARAGRSGNSAVWLNLELPIVGGLGPLVYGVWVTVEAPGAGRLAMALDLWPDTIGLAVEIRRRPSPLRPLVVLAESAHPLSVAQREGISVERHRAIALAFLHDRYRSTEEDVGQGQRQQKPDRVRD